MPKHFHPSTPLDDQTIEIVRPLIDALYRFTEFNADEADKEMPPLEDMAPVLHAMLLAMVAGNPVTRDDMPIEEAIEWADELIEHPGVRYFWAINNPLDFERLSLDALYDPNWRDRQPEPTSDCGSEDEHYAALATTSVCPWCLQSERP